MLKCKGTSIYPQGIYNILSTFAGVEDLYMEVSGEDLSDRIDIFAALSDEQVELSELERLLRAHCRMSVPVHIVPAQQVRARVFGTSRKPVRFFDLRKKSI